MNDFLKMKTNYFSLVKRFKQINCQIYMQVFRSGTYVFVQIIYFTLHYLRFLHNNCLSNRLHICFVVMSVKCFFHLQISFVKQFVYFQVESQKSVSYQVGAWRATLQYQQHLQFVIKFIQTLEGMNSYHAIIAILIFIVTTLSGGLDSSKVIQYLHLYFLVFLTVAANLFLCSMDQFTFTTNRPNH